MSVSHQNIISARSHSHHSNSRERAAQRAAQRYRAAAAARSATEWMLEPTLATADGTNTDPPIADQLRPLPTAELIRRAAAWSSGIAGTSDTAGSSGIAGSDIGNVAAGTSDVADREAALAAAAAAITIHPRPERQLHGEPVPLPLLTALLSALHHLKWPKALSRPGVNAQHYLVLSARLARGDLGTRHPHYCLTSC